MFDCDEVIGVGRFRCEFDVPYIAIQQVSSTYKTRTAATDYLGIESRVS